MKAGVIAYNKEQKLFEKGDKIIVGVSGGKDSVCLLHILNELKEEYSLSLMAVHINHSLRGETADEDAAFVENMAAQMGIPCHVEKVDVRAEAKIRRISEEEAGREVRYAVMEMLRVEHGFNKIAVAHHQDDVAETVLFNLLRGTGPKGLSGIAAKRGYTIRPILFAAAEEISEYIKENQLLFRVDSTNEMDVYTRNKIRLNIFPLLEQEINARAKAHVAEAATRIALQNEYIGKQAKKAYLKVVRMEAGEYNYRVEDFENLEKVIQVEVLRLILQNLIPSAKDIDKTHYRMIRGLATKEVGKRINLPEGVVVQRTYEEVRFYQSADERQENEICMRCTVPMETVVEMDRERAVISMQVADRQVRLDEIPQKDYTKWIDYDKIQDDIFLRNPREGDYLSLKGRTSKKKLSRYFIDEKVPADRRSAQVVLADGSHIICVLNSGRMSERYKVTEDTKRILMIEIKRN